MRLWSFRRTLQGMYPDRDEARIDLPARIEVDVMQLYRLRHGAKRAWTTFVNPRQRIGRLALGSLLGLALLGACEVPTSTPVAMGQRIHVQFVPEASQAPAGQALDIEVEHVQPGAAVRSMPMHGLPWLGSELQTLLSGAGAERIEFQIHRSDGLPIGMDVLVWGSKITRDEVARLVEEHVHDERILTYDIVPLTGSVSESLGKRISRRVFDIGVSDETAGELRIRILTRLAEQGFDGETVVDVQDGGGTRKVTVEAASSDGSREIADEVIIERPEN